MIEAPACAPIAVHLIPEVSAAKTPIPKPVLSVALDKVPVLLPPIRIEFEKLVPSSICVGPPLIAPKDKLPEPSVFNT